MPLALQLHVGASENSVDLTGLRVTELELETGASSTTIRLPAAGVMRARVVCGAASVRVEVPPSVAARITVTGRTREHRGRTALSSGWATSRESPGYATSPDRVEIAAEAGVGEVRIV